MGYFHRHTDTLGPGEAVTFSPEKTYTMPECVSTEIGMQTRRTQIA